MITEISTDNLVDDRQIGWIQYMEGACRLRVKVVRAADNMPFLAHPTAYRQGTMVRVVEYEDRLFWNKLQERLLAEFRKVVGEWHYWNYRGTKGEKP